MKTIIDLSFVLGNYNTGLAKYAYRLLEYISKSNQQSKYILLTDIISQDYIRSQYPEYEIEVIGKKWMNRTGWFKYYFLAYDFLRKVNSLSADVIFCPSANATNMFKTRAKKITAIHDLQTRIDKGARNKRIIWRQMYAEDKITENSAAIVTISDFSKKQILTYYPNLESKLYNFSNSVSMLDADDIEPMNAGYPYLLYVGRLDEMKNVITLVKAFNLIKERYPEYKLVLLSASWSYYNEYIEPIVKENSLDERIVKVVNCSEEDLTKWYKGASMFVFTSLREGFGSPPVEAAYMQIPVVTSTCDSLSEVTRGLLNYYEPATDPESLANTIIRVLDSPPTKEELKNIKDELISNYSIDVFGKKLCDFLDSYKS